MTKNTMRVTLAPLSFCEGQHRQLSSLAVSVDAEVTPLTLSTCILQQVYLHQSVRLTPPGQHFTISGGVEMRQTQLLGKFSNFKSTVPLQTLELRAPTIYKPMCALEMSVLAHSDIQARHPEERSHLSTIRTMSQCVHDFRSLLTFTRFN